MFRQVLRVLLKWRWPIIVTALLMLLLTATISPRPSAIYRLPVLGGTNPFHSTMCVSPSGRYVAIVDKLETKLTLFDLHQQNELWSINGLVHGNHSSGFDADGGFAFARYATGNIEFRYWQPGADSASIVSSQPVIQGDSNSSERFHGLRSFDRMTCENCLLSPDGRTWLLLEENKSYPPTLSMALMESRTGQVRQHLGRKDFALKPGDQPYDDKVNESRHYHPTSFVAAFTPDSRHILGMEERQRQNVPFRPRLQCFDTNTGLCMWSELLPKDNSRRRVCRGFIASERQAVFVKVDGLNYWWHQQWHETSSFKLFPMQETIPVPTEQTIANSRYGASIESHDHRVFLTRNGRVLTAWWHSLDFLDGASSGQSPQLPGYHVSLRELDTGKLVRHETFENPPTPGQVFHNNTAHLFALLTDDHILMHDDYQEPTPWLDRVNLWRERYANWLPSLKQTYKCKLIAIDAATGSRLGKLTLKNEVPAQCINLFSNRSMSLNTILELRKIKD